ncbi:carboxymuconolactone decarboxylase family protein [Pectinatus haikarae]|uniref:carboxymuconolactone decarboxylase family protein n=1 Tax=Pectinatus haikarae TaxID=349096 RepID=UPI0018C46611|nr:carboxymuconolactone decarboxylase family protein [Pectinatus haikarae]
MAWKKLIVLGLTTGIIMTNFLSVEAANMANNEKETTKPAAKKIVQTAGHDVLGDFAPDFARYNDDILFGEVWSRNDKLSLHDRSLITISALIGSGVTDSSLKYHIQTAKQNGVTKDEMVEMLTQLGFYAGWPKAWAAFRMAKEVYEEK